MTWLEASKVAALVTGFITLALSAPFAFLVGCAWLLDHYGPWSLLPAAVVVMFLVALLTIKAGE